MNVADAISECDLFDGEVDRDPVYVCIDCDREIDYPPTKWRCEMCCAAVELEAELLNTENAGRVASPAGE